ncbi:MAG: hypothetical protein M3P51_15895 [Chloroflexota bacterium]|nr:hypothetical protein [Chloroflexota bacterium]
MGDTERAGAKQTGDAAMQERVFAAPKRARAVVANKEGLDARPRPAAV